jgi:hypothetical protein
MTPEFEHIVACYHLVTAEYQTMEAEQGDDVFLVVPELGE